MTSTEVEVLAQVEDQLAGLELNNGEGNPDTHSPNSSISKKKYPPNISKTKKKIDLNGITCLSQKHEEHRHMVSVELPWLVGDQGPHREAMRTRFLDDGLGNTWRLKIDQQRATSNEQGTWKGNLHICLFQTNKEEKDEVTFQVVDSKLLQAEEDIVKDKMTFTKVGQEHSHVKVAVMFLPKDSPSECSYVWANKMVFIIAKHTEAQDMCRCLKQIAQKEELEKKEQHCTELLDSFQEGLFSDVVLRCEGQDFQCHKLLLASQSPVFEAMFRDDMKENQTGIVDIEDIDADVVKEMVNFIYTGEAGSWAENFPGLMHAAHMYDIVNMKEKCFHLAEECMNADNALEVFHLANLFEWKEVAMVARMFVRDNFQAVKKTEMWEMMKSDKHIVEGLLDVLHKMDSWK